MSRVYVRSLTVPQAAVDAIGHVNNLEYVRWMQDIASEHSTAQGWPLERPGSLLICARRSTW